MMNKKTGFLAGVIVAVYMPLVFFEGELLATGWAVFWAVALLSLFLIAREKPGREITFLLGFCGALCILTRPVFLPFFLAGCGWLFFILFRQKKIRFSLSRITIIGIGFLIVTIPEGILGLSTTGKFRVLPYSGGINLFLGNNPQFKDTTAIRPGLAWEKMLKWPEREGIRSIFEKEDYYRQKVWEYGRDDPVEFAVGLAYKTSQFLSSREIARNVDMYVFHRWSNLLRIGVWKTGKFGFPFGILFALAIVGAVVWIRRVPFPVWLFLILYPAAVILVFVASRYRMPVVPVLSLLASAGILALSEMTKRRQWAKLILLSAIFLACMAGSSVFGPYPEERLDFVAELHYARGVVFQETGQPEKAEEAYLEAIRLRDDFADAIYNLGVLMEKQGKTNRALDYYHRTIEADPRYPHPYYNIGILLLFRQKPEDAVRYLQKAVEVEPSDVYAHNNLGSAYRSLGESEMAIYHYRLALKYQPDYDAAINNIAYALLGQGRMDEAAGYFRKALELRPFWPPALAGMGRILATHPDPEKRDPKRAINLAEQAAKITEYKEPLVLNILAMAYAAAGDFRRAEIIAERALQQAEAAGNRGLATQIQENLALFRQKKRNSRDFFP
jgi:tetratricopeptide (TPR) repeat protein